MLQPNMHRTIRTQCANEQLTTASCIVSITLMYIRWQGRNSTSRSKGLVATKQRTETVLQTSLKDGACAGHKRGQKGRTRTCGAVGRAGRRVARTCRAIAGRRWGVRCSEDTIPSFLVNTAGCCHPFQVRQAPGGSALVPAVMLHRFAGVLLAPHSPCMRHDLAHAGSAQRSGAP